MRHELLQSRRGPSRGELCHQLGKPSLPQEGADTWPAHAPEKTMGYLGSASGFFSVNKALCQQPPLTRKEQKGDIPMG